MDGEDMETKERVRLYVGGLGKKVTESDLKDIVNHSFGRVEAVEIIRTKGRSFAYLDFEPCSAASLPKLFSTYNGCVWKSGKLKLERAREHYLARLRREWTEASLPSSKGKASSLHMLKNKTSPDDRKLKMFIPRLGKVKTLSFSGTGKHKYSFRRTEVPLLSQFFCDCDEHSRVVSDAMDCQSRRNVKEDSGGMSEKEITTMSSIVTKIFAREKVCIEPDVDTPANSTAVLPLEDDDDNLIINVARNGNQNSVQHKISRLMENSITDSVMNGDSTCNPLDGKAPPGLSSSYDKQPIPEPPMLGRKSSWKELVQSGGGRSSVSVSQILQSIGNRNDEVVTDSSSSKEEHLNSDGETVPMQESGASATPQEGERDLTMNSSGRGLSWLHDCSWTQLVADSSCNAFSIRQFLPNDFLERQHVAEGENVEVVQETTKVDAAEVAPEYNKGAEENAHLRMVKFGDEQPDSNQNIELIAPQRVNDSDMGEACLFVRSSASLKDWATAKASLNGSRKKRKKAI